MQKLGGIGMKSTRYKYEIGDEAEIISVDTGGDYWTGRIVNRYFSDEHNHCARPHVRYGILVDGDFTDVSESELQLVTLN
jgi:hypothetical protein